MRTAFEIVRTAITIRLCPWTPRYKPRSKTVVNTQIEIALGCLGEESPFVLGLIWLSLLISVPPDTLHHGPSLHRRKPRAFVVLCRMKEPICRGENCHNTHDGTGVVWTTVSHHDDTHWRSCLDLLISEDVTGMLTGKQYMIVMSGAKRTVAALTIHPKAPRLNARDLGRTLSLRPCHISNAAGRAKLHC